MRLSELITRLKELPLRHKALAAAIALLVATAASAIPSLSPRQFRSFAILSSKAPAAAAPADTRELVEQASLILAGQHQQPSAASRHMQLSQISSTQLRITYQAPNANEAQSAVERYTDLLCAPRAALHPPSQTEQASLQQPNPVVEKQQALVRLTIAVLDTRIADYRTSLKAADANHPADESRITRLLDQKKILEARLDESLKPTHAVLSPAFILTQAATAPQPAPMPPSHIPTLGVFAGILLGIAYLAFTLWRFRPLPNAATLAQLLPNRRLLIGTIGDFRQ